MTAFVIILIVGLGWLAWRVHSANLLHLEFTVALMEEASVKFFNGNRQDALRWVLTEALPNQLENSAYEKFMKNLGRRFRVSIEYDAEHILVSEKTIQRLVELVQK